MSLYAESKAYLIAKLKEAGVRTKPYTAMKRLEKSQESHVSAVIFDKETISRNGSKKCYRDQQGAKKKRRKVFDRDLSFAVIIGDYSDDAVETIFEQFLESLDRGIWVNENFVPIEAEDAEWADEEDSILKARVAVRVMVTFQGGLYRDTDFAPLTNVEIEAVEKINGKEPVNGN